MSRTKCGVVLDVTVTVQWREVKGVCTPTRDGWYSEIFREDDKLWFFFLSIFLKSHQL